MSQPPRRGPRWLHRVMGAGSGPKGMIIVAIVSLVAGLLLGTSIATAKRQGTNAEIDLPTLVQARQERILQMEDEVSAMDDQVQALSSMAITTEADLSERALSRMEVSGPGVEVVLSDAANEFVPAEGANVNDLVVHQQDVDAVINALWRGGAEAITVQGVRLAANTPVRCVGNVILVGARSYAPPYEIAAIGDPESLSATLELDERIALYRRDAVKYQMGWSVETIQSMTMPPASDIRYQILAQPLGSE